MTPLDILNAYQYQRGLLDALRKLQFAYGGIADEGPIFRSTHPRSDYLEDWGFEIERTLRDLQMKLEDLL